MGTMFGFVCLAVEVRGRSCIFHFSVSIQPFIVAYVLSFFSSRLLFCDGFGSLSSYFMWRLDSS